MGNERLMFIEDLMENWYVIPIGTIEEFHHWIKHCEKYYTCDSDECWEGTDFDEYKLSGLVSDYSFDNLQKLM